MMAPTRMKSPLACGQTRPDWRWAALPSMSISQTDFGGDILRDGGGDEDGGAAGGAPSGSAPADGTSIRRKNAAHNLRNIHPSLCRLFLRINHLEVQLFELFLRRRAGRAHQTV